VAGAAIAAVESHGPATWPAIFSADEFDLDQLPNDARELVIDRLRSFLGYAVCIMLVTVPGVVDEVTRIP
jgi:hypothetical protein